MGWSKAINEQVDPLIEVLRPVPPLAWIPLSILWFGIGDMQNQFIIFLGMFFPILLNTIAGVKNIEPNIIRAARCLGASEARILRRDRAASGVCRRSSPVFASASALAGWRWWRPSWSAPILASAF